MKQERRHRQGVELADGRDGGIEARGRIKGVGYGGEAAAGKAQAPTGGTAAGWREGEAEARAGGNSIYLVVVVWMAVVVL